MKGRIQNPNVRKRGTNEIEEDSQALASNDGTIPESLEL